MKASMKWWVLCYMIVCILTVQGVRAEIPDDFNRYSTAVSQDNPDGTWFPSDVGEGWQEMSVGNDSGSPEVDAHLTNGVVEFVRNGWGPRGESSLQHSIENEKGVTIDVRIDPNSYFGSDFVELWLIDTDNAPSNAFAYVRIERYNSLADANSPQLAVSAMFSGDGVWPSGFAWALYRQEIPAAAGDWGNYSVEIYDADNSGDLYIEYKLCGSVYRFDWFDNVPNFDLLKVTGAWDNWDSASKSQIDNVGVMPPVAATFSDYFTRADTPLTLTNNPGHTMSWETFPSDIGNGWLELSQGNGCEWIDAQVAPDAHLANGSIEFVRNGWGNWWGQALSQVYHALNGGKGIKLDVFVPSDAVLGQDNIGLWLTDSTTNAFAHLAISRNNAASDPAGTEMGLTLKWSPDGVWSGNWDHWLWPSGDQVDQWQSYEMEIYDAGAGDLKLEIRSKNNTWTFDWYDNVPDFESVSISCSWTGWGGVSNPVFRADNIEAIGISNCADAIDAGYGLLADINNDCHVNLFDYALLAMDWMEDADPVTGDQHPWEPGSEGEVFADSFDRIDSDLIANNWVEIGVHPGWQNEGNAEIDGNRVKFTRVSTSGNNSCAWLKQSLTSQAHNIAVGASVDFMIPAGALASDGMFVQLEHSETAALAIMWLHWIPEEGQYELLVSMSPDGAWFPEWIDEGLLPATAQLGDTITVRMEIVDPQSNGDLKLRITAKEGATDLTIDWSFGFENHGTGDFEWYDNVDYFDIVGFAGIWSQGPTAISTLYADNFETVPYSIVNCSDVILLGYNSTADLDFDCDVDLYDVTTLVDAWLDCMDPFDSECQHLWLLP